MRLFGILLGAALCAPALADDTHPLMGDGKSLYKQFCAHCHGIDMVNPGTGSYDLRRFPKDDKPRFFHAVTKGVGDMPAWGDILVPDEVEAIWVYVATRAGKEPFPDQANDTEVEPTIPTDLAASGQLTACLARNGGAMSTWRHSGGAGLDYAVLKAIAGRLGLGLMVTWFESDQDEFADPIVEAYAMLSHELCDVVAAHPVMPRAGGAPPQPTAAIPRWTDMPDTWVPHHQVPLKPIAASLAYRRAELGIVVSSKAPDRSYASLSDLDGTRIGVQQGTMSEAILRRNGPATAMQTAITLPPGPKFLWDMETGSFDTTLIAIGAFDFHHRQNRLSALELKGYRHPFGLDISLAVLSERDAFLAALDVAIQDIAAKPGFEALADAEGVTYTPPLGGPAPDLRVVLQHRE